jgi:hypothetical protein
VLCRSRGGSVGYPKLATRTAVVTVSTLTAVVACDLALRFVVGVTPTRLIRRAVYELHLRHDVLSRILPGTCPRARWQAMDGRDADGFRHVRAGGAGGEVDVGDWPGGGEPLPCRSARRGAGARGHCQRRGRHVHVGLRRFDEACSERYPTHQNPSLVVGICLNDFLPGLRG